MTSILRKYRYLLADTSSTPVPTTLAASGPVSKTTWTRYGPAPLLGTRHECEQNPPHEKPVMPRLIILPSGDNTRISAERAAESTASFPIVHDDK